MRKVLHIFKKLDSGGAELRTLAVIKKTNSEKIKHHILVLSGELGTLDQEYKKNNCKIHYIKKKGKFPFREFKKIINENSINVVHSNTLYFSGYFLLIARMFGVKNRIAHFRSNGDGKKKTYTRSLIVFLLKKLILMNATSIIAVSESTMNAVWQKEWREDPKFKVIYNGFSELISDEKYPFIENHQLDPNAVILLQVGRVVEAKNHIFTIKLLKELQQHCKVYCFFVGNDNTSYAEKVKEVSNKSKLNNVYFLGVKQDIYRYMNGADIILSPSTREGLPGVLIEAGLSSTACIASDIEPNKEVARIFHDKIYTEKLDTEKWINKILFIHSEKVKPKNYSINNTPFDIEVNAKKIAEVWKK